jgi:hypothetical protein
MITSQNSASIQEQLKEHDVRSRAGFVLKSVLPGNGHDTGKPQKVPSRDEISIMNVLPFHSLSGMTQDFTNTFSGLPRKLVEPFDQLAQDRVAHQEATEFIQMTGHQIEQRQIPFNRLTAAMHIYLQIFLANSTARDGCCSPH